MANFKSYLETIGEIGYVDQVVHSLVYVSGLPTAHPDELVRFESDDLGQVVSLTPEAAEILLFSRSHIKVGAKVVRTNERLQIAVSGELLGRAVDPLGRVLDKGRPFGTAQGEKRAIDITPVSIDLREQVNEALETGVTLVDLVVPLGKGQRELVIGDRKTGKTEFLLQTILTQARRGTICIYAVIGQKQIEIRKLEEFFATHKITAQTVIVATTSFDPAGLIFATPYSAMTIAEYFRDQGRDVLLVLDDMTSHARFYREISLIARRFPGRNSYPGDIFYVQAKLVERAGKFKRGSITCLPLAESVFGDLSGYIQTNLMAMTDGHIFFDIGLYSQGKRPAINPFLSVTRVGHQTQTVLARDASRELSRFLVTYEKMKQFLHFGAAVAERVREVLTLGERLEVFFNQPSEEIIPLEASLLLLAGLWVGLWHETKLEEIRNELNQVVTAYTKDEAYRKKISDLLRGVKTFFELTQRIRYDNSIILQALKGK